MNNIDPEQAKGIASLIGHYTGGFSDKVSVVSSWISNFIGGLSWFEWAIIIFIIVIVTVVIILKRKVESLQTMTRKSFYNTYGRRRR